MRARTARSVLVSGEPRAPQHPLREKQQPGCLYRKCSTPYLPFLPLPVANGRQLRRILVPKRVHVISAGRRQYTLVLTTSGRHRLRQISQGKALVLFSSACCYITFFSSSFLDLVDKSESASRLQNNMVGLTRQTSEDGLVGIHVLKLLAQELDEYGADDVSLLEVDTLPLDDADGFHTVKSPRKTKSRNNVAPRLACEGLLKLKTSKDVFLDKDGSSSSLEDFSPVSSSSSCRTKQLLSPTPGRDMDKISSSHKVRWTAEVRVILSWICRPC